MAATRKTFVAPRLVEVATLASLTQTGIIIITDCPRGQTCTPQ